MYNANVEKKALCVASCVTEGLTISPLYSPEGFNDCGGRGYDDFVPGEVTEIAPSGDETTWSVNLPRIHRI